MKRVFISFDFDHDKELCGSLVNQAKDPDSPFNIIDYSPKESFEENWRNNVRKRIRMADLVIVICGKHTDTAKGVSAELSITREEHKPYFLLQGRSDGNCQKPLMAQRTDKIYPWTWNNLKILIEGKR